MGMMIGIALEEKWASAAVVRKNNKNALLSLGNIHPEKICDSAVESGKSGKERTHSLK